MKRRVRLLFIVVLAVLLVCTLSACGGKDITFGIPVGWEDYLDELAVIIADTAMTEGGKISVEINGRAQYDSSNYSFYTGASYDMSEPDKSLLAIEFNRGADALFSLKSDNSDTYLDIAPNELIGNQKLKLENTNLFNWLNIKYNQDNQQSAVDSLKSFIISAGKTFFRDADVNAEKTVYSFALDSAAQTEKLSQFLRSLSIGAGDTAVKALLGIFGVSDAAELLSYVPETEGNIEFYVADGKLTGIGTQSLSVNGSTGGYFEAQIAVGYDVNDAIENKFPASDAGYKVTKVGCSNLSGMVSLMTSEGNKRAIRYEYELNVNLDLLQLVFNGYDLSKLSEDNFLHFRLSHKCDSNCNEFCRSKIGKARGSVLDVAFSPRDFGNSNFFVNLNIKHFMSADYLADIQKYYSSVTDTVIPEYVMFCIPFENFNAENPLCKILLSVYSTLIGSKDGQCVYGTEELKEYLKDSPLSSLILEDYLISEEYNNDLLKFSVEENIYGQVNAYDIYKETVYLIASDVSDVKQYSAALGKDYTAIAWKFEPAVTAKDGDAVYELNNIYDANRNLLHGAKDGEYVPMSPLEAQELKRCSLMMSYTDIYKNTVNDWYAEIVAVEGLDLDERGVQKITLSVKYPNALDYVWGFMTLDMTVDALNKFFKNNNEEFVVRKEVCIKLTDEVVVGGFSLRTSDSATIYDIVFNASDAPAFLNATATLKYINGSSKQIETEGESSAVRKSVSVLAGTRYSITEWGVVNVVFNVAGRRILRNYRIATPDSFEFEVRNPATVYEVGEPCSGIHSTVYLYAVYGSGETAVKTRIHLTESDYYINNISLAEASTDWGHLTSLGSAVVVFYKSNDYKAQIKKSGFISPEFIISVRGKQQSQPAYAFKPANELPQILFVGNNNQINGALVNALHGDGDSIDAAFTLEVLKGEMSNGSIRYTKPVADNVVKLTLNIDTATSSTGVMNYRLPAMIVNPISASIGFVFAQPGYYRVVLTMKWDRYSSKQLLVQDYVVVSGAAAL